MPRRTKTITSLAGSGDDGSTGLLGGGRAPKDDPRIEAYGTIDEASSALGLARSLSQDPEVKSICESLQRGLYKVGAELATNPAEPGKFGAMTAEDLEALDAIGESLEARAPIPSEFILPGATPAAAALDVARTIIRRAERRTTTLGGQHAAARKWLNRLSLVVFVLARYEEQVSGVVPETARPKPA